MVPLQDVADEIVEDLQAKWRELDPDLRGAPGRDDVARSVWAADQGGNGDHNMPEVLPPHLERKVTETMRRVGTGTRCSLHKQ
jgi:hypothetical protein